MLVIMVATALSGCGWHLRGSGGAELTSRVYLDYAKATPDLQRELDQVLAETRVEKKDQADLVLVIHSDRSGRRVLSVDQQGAANEYELQYRLEYSIRDGEGKTVAPADVIEMQRDYSYDPAEALAKDKEERLLFDFMRRAAVQKLIRQLQRAAQNHPAAKPSVNAPEPAAEPNAD